MNQPIDVYNWQMVSESAKIDRFGRILVPAKIREAAGINPDDEVILEVDDAGHLSLKTRLQAVREAQKILRPHFKGRSAVKELLEWRREELKRERKRKRKV